jgi:hypothetical protein
MAKRGKRIEATPELIEAVLSDLARGLTREWACALNGVSHDTWQRWEKRPEFSELRARAIGARVKHLLERLEVEPTLIAWHFRPRSPQPLEEIIGLFC